MSISSDHPPAGLRVFRSLALLLLATQAWLFLADLASWPRMLGIYLLMTLAGLGLGRSRLRFWVRMAGAAALPFALRWAALAVFGVWGLVFRGFGSDSLLPAFDETFYPFLPLWIWAIAAADASERSRAFAVVEAGLDLAALAALLWSQGGFRVTVYPHPSLLAAAAAGALILSLASLAVLAPRGAGRSPGFPFRLAALFAMLALALLAVLGRYAQEASAQGGGLLKPTLFRFDLSRYLKLETEISLSDDLVLVVRKDPVDPNVLIRRFVLSDYDRRGGFRPASADEEIPRTLPRAALTWNTPGWEGRAPLEQEYWILNLEPDALLAVDAPVSVTPYRLEPGSSFTSAYSLVSSAAVPSLPLLLEGFDPGRTPPAFALPEADRERYTRGSGDPRIRDLAVTAVGEALLYYDKVTAVLAYLRENYYYSLKPGAASDGNQLAHFLFASRKGYCSYFAFSMTLLLRSQGIPARVAAGFFLDPDTAVLEFHPVRADMAHAWTEVWFGEYGWIAFDPTSRRPAPGERFVESRGTDPALLEGLLREILRGTREEASSSGMGERGLRGAGEAFRRAASWALRRFWFLLPALYLALAAVFRLFRALRVRVERNGRRRLLLAWQALEEVLAAVGRRRARGESAADFGDRLDREQAGLLGGGWGALAREWERTFFDPALESSHAQAVEEGIGNSRRRVLGSIPLPRKIAAFLDLRRALRPLPGRKLG